MSRLFLHSIMLLPILAATVLTYSLEPVQALSPDQVVSWTEIVAAHPAPSEDGADSTETSAEVD